MSCCSKLGDVLKKIVNALRPILAIVLLATAAYFAFFAGPGMIQALAGFTFLPASIATLSASSTVWAYAALGAALIIDSETVTDTVGSVADTVGTIAGTVLTSVASGVLGGLFGNASVGSLLLFGALAYFFLFSDKAKDNRDEVVGYFKQDSKGKDDGVKSSDAATVSPVAG